jgi:hypothetical protein
MRLLMRLWTLAHLTGLPWPEKGNYRRKLRLRGLVVGELAGCFICGRRARARKVTLLLLAVWLELGVLWLVLAALLVDNVVEPGLRLVGERDQHCTAIPHGRPSHPALHSSG